MERTREMIIERFEGMFDRLSPNGKESMKMVLSDMKKMGQIEEIVKSKTTRVSYDVGFEQIKKVVEDGSM